MFRICEKYIGLNLTRDGVYMSKKIPWGGRGDRSQYSLVSDTVSTVTVMSTTEPFSPEVEDAEGESPEDFKLLAPEDYEFVLMPQLLTDYSEYRGKYILIKNDPDQLFYINSKAELEKIKISDHALFNKKWLTLKSELIKEPKVGDFKPEIEPGRSREYCKFQRNHTEEIEEKISKGLGLILDSAYSEGDCFFDAVARGIIKAGISIPGDSKVPDYKKLRITCREYLKICDSEEDKRWVKSAIETDAKTDGGGADFQTCLMIMQYSHSEIQEKYRLKEFEYKNATWGRPDIEGRIICSRLKIKLHVICAQELDLSEEEGGKKNKQLVIIHQLVDDKGTKQVKDSDIDYKDDKTVHIFLYKEHFVPAFLIRLEAEEQKKHESEMAKTIQVPIRMNMTGDQFKDLITSNGGHIPYRPSKDPGEEEIRRRLNEKMAETSEKWTKEFFELAKDCIENYKIARDFNPKALNRLRIYLGPNVNYVKLQFKENNHKRLFKQYRLESSHTFWRAIDEYIDQYLKGAEEILGSPKSDLTQHIPVDSEKLKKLSSLERLTFMDHLQNVVFKKWREQALKNYRKSFIQNVAESIDNRINPHLIEVNLKRSLMRQFRHHLENQVAYFADLSCTRNFVKDGKLKKLKEAIRQLLSNTEKDISKMSEESAIAGEKRTRQIDEITKKYMESSIAFIEKDIGEDKDAQATYYKGLSAKNFVDFVLKCLDLDEYEPFKQEYIADKYLNTLLHYALRQFVDIGRDEIRTSYMEIIELLFQHGSSANVPNGKGKSAYTWSNYYTKAENFRELAWSILLLDLVNIPAYSEAEAAVKGIVINYGKQIPEIFGAGFLTRLLRDWHGVKRKYRFEDVLKISEALSSTTKTLNDDAMVVAIQQRKAVARRGDSSSLFKDLDNMAVIPMLRGALTAMRHFIEDEAEYQSEMRQILELKVAQSEDKMKKTAEDMKKIQSRLEGMEEREKKHDAEIKEKDDRIKALEIEKKKEKKEYNEFKEKITQKNESLQTQITQQSQSFETQISELRSLVIKLSTSSPQPVPDGKSPQPSPSSSAPDTQAPQPPTQHPLTSSLNQTLLAPKVIPSSSDSTYTRGLSQDHCH